MTASSSRAATWSRRSGDAFRILGPHRVRKKGGKPRWEVRAFLPQVQAAADVMMHTHVDNMAPLKRRWIGAGTRYGKV
jgi:hypothetical protein